MRKNNSDNNPCLLYTSPLDYIEGLEYTVKECLTQAGEQVARNIKGIAVDTTGSTPVAVDKNGTPLALLADFADNPNAMFVLWKDHTSIKEAEEINRHASQFPVNYLKYVGGIYSSEWFWAKLLHILRQDEKVASAMHSWVEHCDWIPFLLTGGSHVSAIRRGVCSAGPVSYTHLDVYKRQPIMYLTYRNIFWLWTLYAMIAANIAISIIKMMS